MQTLQVYAKENGAKKKLEGYVVRTRWPQTSTPGKRKKEEPVLRSNS
jgi:hypothetical protein